MIKLVFCLRRLPHLSLEECQRYWLEKHGPLVRKHAPALRIKRYVQVHRLDSPINEAMRRSRDAGEPYDGVAELWWERVEDLAEATATPEGRDASRELLEDERKFIDFSRSALWVGEEHPIVG
ncbi:MAG TPA: EthD domain-containing protein [Dehalococcoidia bacterium]|nr:EthD domain-containing protein [Dehalococcoidia bacterium]